MLKKFLRNKEGQFAVITALAALPLFGGVAMSIDFSNLSRLRHDLKDSCDASNVEIAKAYMAGGKTKADLALMGRKFYDVNFDVHYLDKSTLTLTLPDDPGNTSKKLELKCKLTYKTIFGPVLAALTHSDPNNYAYVIETSTMKMKNVAEIALVLDNSGSMAEDQSGSTASTVEKSRIFLLKKASKDLVTKLIDLGTKIHNVSNPVKFSVVPFSASVNVGSGNANESWMDLRGVSPIHHEHLNWGVPGDSNPTGYRTTASGDGAKLDADGNPLTRFSILKALQFESMKGDQDTASCRVWKYNTTTDGGTDNPNCAVFNRKNVTPAPVAVTSTTVSNATGISVENLKKKYEWTGCVEERPHPWHINDDMSGKEAKFVPMFAPDSFNLSKYGKSSSDNDSGFNNWWPDYEAPLNWYPTYSVTQAMAFNQVDQFYKTTDNSTVYKTTTGAPTSADYTADAAWRAANSRPREVDVAKYFVNRPYLYGHSNTSATSTSTRRGQWMYYKGAEGPNEGCTTAPITPLTGDKSVIHAAIESMAPGGYTNVPEGIAWGWRTVSSKAPFSEGVSETRKDIDKVVIVLTDGANTYEGIPGSDYARNVSNYAAFGYAGYAGSGGPNGTADVVTASNKARIFVGTTGTSSYNTAMNRHMVGTVNLSIADPLNTDIESNGGVCKNIKDEDIILMTVSLDLNPSVGTDSQMAATKAALAGLKACAGRSRTRKDDNGNYEKLFWNACSSTPNASCKSIDQTFKEIADELSNLRFTN